MFCHALMDGSLGVSQKVDIDVESFAERVIGKELPYRTMYGLEGRAIQ